MKKVSFWHVPMLIMLPFTARAENITAPADMPEAAQFAMTTLITEYNKCMMSSRLDVAANGKDAQNHANEILQSCENHLVELQNLLDEQNVNASLSFGMIKTLRSRAARKLMAQTMNNLAAQAMAAENAKK
ncbi:hypothetical protein Q7C_2664 [Methylophaga frappieri]|uniref:Uncharacterized protein n=1 Tax=Methylophaga frappieri (strain ATCC BAA-2434 / DSM 25690 / JAM7) TaxID=754477 RepID=I1YLJ2_METFJ|nr:hypothetical protein [Methylophaga frappieri]AFJ03785.1 hypothetical protein Q7C_2664 [Methylophaga frappieri]